MGSSRYGRGKWVGESNGGVIGQQWNSKALILSLKSKEKGAFINVSLLGHEN